MFKLPNQNHKKQTKGNFSRSRDEAAPGTPLFRKTLSKGIQAEANNDGTIFISDIVEAGSAEERKILTHEMKHLTDMKTGKLKYDDNWIKWNGTEYPRAEGKILYEGEWVPEGGKEFPWEKH